MISGSLSPGHNGRRDFACKILKCPSCWIAGKKDGWGTIHPSCKVSKEEEEEEKGGYFGLRLVSSGFFFSL